MKAEELFKYFELDLTRKIADELGKSTEEKAKLIEKAAKGDSMVIQLLQKTRHFNDGLIIGSKTFIMEHMQAYKDQSYLNNKTFSFDKDLDLYCFKRLRNST